MSLEVYYSQDILNALLAAEQASNEALTAAGGEGGGSEFALGYEAGYRAALTTIALAFGLIRPDGRHGSSDGQPAFLPVTAGAER
jgi:hypothetical protein